MQLFRPMKVSCLRAHDIVMSCLVCRFAGICRHFRHVPLSVPLFSQPIGTFRIGSWVSGIAEPGGPPLQVLRWDESLSRALALLSEGLFPLLFKIYVPITSLFMGCL